MGVGDREEWTQGRKGGREGELTRRSGTGVEKRVDGWTGRQ